MEEIRLALGIQTSRSHFPGLDRELKDTYKQQYLELLLVLRLHPAALYEQIGFLAS